MATYAAYRHIELDKVGAGKKRTNKKKVSSSDSESDEDYVPQKGAFKIMDENDDVNSDDDGDSLNSEENDDNEDEDETEDDTNRTRAKTSNKRSRKSGRARGKKRKKSSLKSIAVANENEEDTVADVVKKDDDSGEQDIDELWNEFKKDCESKGVKSTSTAKLADSTETELHKLSAGNSETVEKSYSDDAKRMTKTQTVTELFEFAGETVEVKKEIPVDEVTTSTFAKEVTNVSSSSSSSSPPPLPPPPPSEGATRKLGRGGGLSSVLGQIGKKNKLSILEKSKLDWNSFKQEEGITEDLQTHNKGKDGYLERQDFLQRTDLRQFEIEKALRNSRRLKY